jgi:predicted hotdog family 3-hydroxylacyl-ACP dehydratase
MSVSLTRAELCQLLPHTGAMCLLDEVADFNGREIRARSRSHQDPDNPLRRDGQLPAICGIEYVAQAIGIHGRLATRNQQKPAAGFLASLRDVQCAVERLDDIDAPLDIIARRVADAADSVMCEFELRAGARTLLTGRATLLLEAR